MYMTDNEFLSDFLMDRACILQLNRLVENDEVFGNCMGNRSKWSSMLHIMVLLNYIGSHGNEASFQNIGQTMGTSKWAVNQCVIYACSAILKLQEQVIKWPNEEERK